MLATPFLRTDYMSYLTRAFDFSRVFLFKWSVNWTFLGQDVFLSKAFASSLLLAHFSLLLLFIHTRWLRPSGKTLLDLPSLLLSSRSPAYQKRVSSQVTPRFIALTFYASIVIGMLCARSLHYQFFSWLAWGTPFLLWQSSFPPQLQIVIWAVQEYAWNVYPSTPQSSAMIVGCLATILYGVFTKRDTGSTIAKASTIKDSIEPNSSAALNKRNMTKPSRSR